MQGMRRGGLAVAISHLAGGVGQPSPRAIGAVAVFVALVAAACGGGSGGFDDLRLVTPADLGGAHLNPGQPYDQYNSIPPTSGPHDPNLLRCGIYGNPQSFERSLHTMEHGAVLMVYHPDQLSIGQVADLQVIADEQLGNGRRIIMMPDRQLQAPLSLAAWGNLINLSGVEDEVIRDFVGAFENEGPERIPRPNAC